MRKLSNASLLKQMRDFVFKVKYQRKIINSYVFNSARLNQGIGYNLDEVYKHALLARKLGYETVIVADESGMTIQYKEDVAIPKLFL